MIKIGSCSWAERTLLESREFYPENVTTAEGRLKYYAENFCTVEVDSSYYAIPNIKTSWFWVERSPEGFVFHIKSYGALTGHSIDVKTLPKDIQGLIPETEKRKKFLSVKDPSLLKIITGRFIDSLAPLKEAKKLGLIVFQFPPWFHYKEANLNYILSCQEMMKGLEIAVEFRHGSWLSPAHAGDVFSFLKKNRITSITADEPQYGSLATIPFLPEATTETAYIRLHGRNRDNWLKKGIETSLRYSYFYSDEELKEFIPAISGLSKKAEKTYVMFNNCHGSFAIKNAFRLRELLQNRKDMAPAVS
jgi:uncharacterized protein YecE (DUF72 family)